MKHTEESENVITNIPVYNGSRRVGRMDGVFTAEELRSIRAGNVNDYSETENAMIDEDGHIIFVEK